MRPAERAAYRAQVTAWLTDHAVSATRSALTAALAGERDLPTLHRANVADGVAVKRTPTGDRLPASLADGDLLAAPVAGVVVGTPERDPETGGWWLTVRRTDHASDTDLHVPTATTEDVELDPATVVTVTPKPRRLAPWLAAAHADWHAARHTWETAREAETNGHATEMREYGIVHPAPRFSDFVKQHAAMLRQDDTEDATARVEAMREQRATDRAAQEWDGDAA